MFKRSVSKQRIFELKPIATYQGTFEAKYV